MTSQEEAIFWGSKALYAAYTFGLPALVGNRTLLQFATLYLLAQVCARVWPSPRSTVSMTVVFESSKVEDGGLSSLQPLGPSSFPGLCTLTVLGASYDLLPEGSGRLGRPGSRKDEPSLVCSAGARAGEWKKHASLVCCLWYALPGRCAPSVLPSSHLMIAKNGHNRPSSPPILFPEWCSWRVLVLLSLSPLPVCPWLDAGLPVPSSTRRP